MIYEGESSEVWEAETPSRYSCKGSLPTLLPTSQNTDVFHGSESPLPPAQSHEKGSLNMSLGRVLQAIRLFCPHFTLRLLKSEQNAQTCLILWVILPDRAFPSVVDMESGERLPPSPASSTTPTGSAPAVASAVSKSGLSSGPASLSSAVNPCGEYPFILDFRAPFFPWFCVCNTALWIACCSLDLG